MPRPAPQAILDKQESDRAAHMLRLKNMVTGNSRDYEMNAGAVDAARAKRETEQREAWIAKHEREQTALDEARRKKREEMHRTQTAMLQRQMAEARQRREGERDDARQQARH